MKNYALIFGTLLILVVGGLWSVHAWEPKVSGVRGCTEEAKLCPDGSAVGRTGPNCEFALCPVAATTTVATNTPGLGMSTTINGTSIRVLELVEDSRCPIDVQCVWAGTVRVRATVDSYGDFTFTFGQPQVIGDAVITLSSVIPAQKYAGQAVQPSEYRFTFTVVSKQASSATGVRGTVSLGPTCPVMRNPPDPECADRPYTTTIVVHRAGSSLVFANGKSDENGVFEISLPAGSYTIVAEGGQMLPRCSPVDISVSASGYTTANISCDTGIR